MIIIVYKINDNSEEIQILSPDFLKRHNDNKINIKIFKGDLRDKGLGINGIAYNANNYGYINYNDFEFNCKDEEFFKLEININGPTTDLNGIFKECYHLIYIDFCNCNTDKIININGIFKECHLLEEIKTIKNLDTSKATNMRNIFGGC